MTAELRVTAYCLDCCTTNTVARPLVALATLSCATRSHAVALLHDAEAPRAQWARRTYHRVLSNVRHRHVESFGHLGGLR
jgi:hypothetical protein